MLIHPAESKQPMKIVSDTQGGDGDEVAIDLRDLAQSEH